MNCDDYYPCIKNINDNSYLNVLIVLAFLQYLYFKHVEGSYIPVGSYILVRNGLKTEENGPRNN